MFKKDLEDPLHLVGVHLLPALLHLLGALQVVKGDVHEEGRVPGGPLRQLHPALRVAGEPALLQLDVLGQGVTETVHQEVRGVGADGAQVGVLPLMEVVAKGGVGSAGVGCCNVGLVVPLERPRTKVCFEATPELMVFITLVLNGLTSADLVGR